MMRNFLKTLFTGQDNKSADIGRVAFAVQVLAFIGFTAWSIHRGQSWDAVTWAGAASALSLGLSGSLLLKHKTEPQA